MKPKSKEKQHLKNKKSDQGKYWPYYAGGIVLITFIVLSAIPSAGFLNWDDPDFVLNNSLVTSLSFENVKKMFSVFVSGNYCPLTTLSYAADYHLAGGFSTKLFHSTSLVLHLVNTFLVFLFIYRLSGKQVIIAGIASLLFGIHPMHIESVAWVAERRDLLYAMFYLLGLIAYLKYLEGERQIKYLIYTILFFMGSLFSKGQAVTFPIVIVLIDYIKERKMEFKSLAEKIPFFLLALVFGYVAIQGQKTTPAVSALHLSSLEKIFVGCYGLLLYFLKAIIPFNLSGFHPYPAELPLVARLSPLIILALVFIIWKKLRNERKIVGGLLIFLLTIFPVLQFFPVGNALMAERYTYIPYIGLFFIIGYGYHTLENYSWLKPVKSYAGAILIVFFVLLSIVAIGRTKVWKDAFAYWTDILEHYPDCAVAYNQRGLLYGQINQLDMAMKDFNEGISHDSTYAKLFANRGLAFDKQGFLDQAIKDYTVSLRLDSSNKFAWYNKGNSDYKKGNFSQAISDYSASIKLDSTYSQPYIGRGILYADPLKQFDSAIADFKSALRLNPGNADVLFNTGISYFRKGDSDNAILYYNKLIEIKPSDSRAFYFRALARNAKKENEQALLDLNRAKELGYSVDENLILQFEQLAGQKGSLK